MRAGHIHDIAGLRRRAARKLPRPIFDYIEGGAEDELALRDSRAAFDPYRFLPRMLADVSSPHVETELFGRRLSLPVMLSNHGGRQLESAMAPIDCVAPVADAVGGRMKIVCDGGIRRGRDIVKALALGADACSIGRAYLYGLAAGGADGVRRAIELLCGEYERTLTLAGIPDRAALGPELLRKTGGA